MQKKIARTIGFSILFLALTANAGSYFCKSPDQHFLSKKGTHLFAHPETVANVCLAVEFRVSQRQHNIRKNDQHVPGEHFGDCKASKRQDPLNVSHVECFCTMTSGNFPGSNVGAKGFVSCSRVG